MERTFLSGKTLDDEPGIPVNENTHGSIIWETMEGGDVSGTSGITRLALVRLRGMLGLLGLIGSGGGVGRGRRRMNTVGVFVYIELVGNLSRGRFELLDPLAQTAGNLGDALCPEYQQDGQKNQSDFERTKTSHGLPLVD